MMRHSVHLAILMVLFSSLSIEAQPIINCEQASPVYNLLSSFGINTHMQQGWQYSDAEKTVATLKDLGIAQIREPFVGLGQPGHEYAAKQGIKFVFFIQGGNLGDRLPRLEAWEKRYPGSIIAIEGPNEVNNWPIKHRGLAGVPAAQAFQQELYDRVHASPILREIPVVALTSWPVFSNRSDIGNIHAYARSGGYLGPWVEQGLYDEQTLNPPAKPTWMTESGYHTHLGSDYDEGISENLQAKMVTTLFLSTIFRNIDKTFYYQLANQYTDPNDQQSYFGLVDQRWMPKPAYQALKAMISIVRDVSGSLPAHSRSLRYQLEGLPSTAYHKLFSTKSGGWLIAVWNEPTEVWDKANDIEISAQKSEIMLQLGETNADISLFDPLVGSSAVHREKDARSFPFQLSGSPVFIRLDPTVASDECN